MKPRHRSDEVAPAIVQVLQDAGCYVVPFESPFAGQPDFLVGHLGWLTLLEVKSERGRLSDDQVAAHEAWARVGVRVYTVRTPREALEAVGIVGRRAEENLRAMRMLVSEKRRVAQVRGRLQPAVRRPGP